MLYGDLLSFKTNGLLVLKEGPVAHRGTAVGFKGKNEFIIQLYE